MSAITELRFAAQQGCEVSALFERPAKARWLLVLAHGAGAGMRHAFLESLASELANSGLATFRYQFPYMEQRRRIPDPPAVLMATVRAAVRTAVEAAPGLPLLAGGKSLGGRMTSLASAEQPLEIVRGLVFFGFPLHPPDRPGTKRADHLRRISVPMLFLQGTRDRFAELDLLRPICSKLGSRVKLHVVGAADHSFHVLRGSGRTDAELLRELAHTVATWAETTC
jgi:predicted alpha/beta-hydrolase family hydrolase